jgi:hypothetical protein
VREHNFQSGEVIVDVFDSELDVRTGMLSANKTITSSVSATPAVVRAARLVPLMARRGEQCAYKWLVADSF